METFLMKYINKEMKHINNEWLLDTLVVTSVLI